MKITIKITILIIAIILAIGGVMIYAKTKVEPPMATTSIDQYSKNIDDEIMLFSSLNSQNKEDLHYHTLMNKIEIYEEEFKLTKEAGDKMIDKVLKSYTPLFIEHAYSAFSKSKWYDEDHNRMLTTINTLKSVKHYNNSSTALSNENMQELKKIQNIISDYQKARAVSRQTTFKGIKAAQNTINQAQKFANHQYLSNCIDLVNALNNVKSSLASSHYKYIDSQVELLAQYRNISQYSYINELVPKVRAAIEEYENKAYSLYGSKRNVDELWSKARTYYNSALYYYED